MKRIEFLKWYPTEIMPTKEQLKRTIAGGGGADAFLHQVSSGRTYVEENLDDENPDYYDRFMNFMEKDCFWLIAPSYADEIDEEKNKVLQLEGHRPSYKSHELAYFSNDLGFLVTTTDDVTFLGYFNEKGNDLLISDEFDADFYNSLLTAIPLPALPSEEEIEEMKKEERKK